MTDDQEFDGVMYELFRACPHVFRDGVPDIQPDLREVLTERRTIRTAAGPLIFLHLDDVVAVTKRRDIRNMDLETLEQLAAHGGRRLIPIMLDGDEHTKYRKLLDPLFSPRVVATLETSVRALADELIDGFVGDGRVELYKTFCEPLPAMVFLRLLGLPLDDLEFLLWFKEGIIRPADADHMRNAHLKMIEYLQAELDRREEREQPGDDLIGGFLTAELDSAPLSRDDIIDITVLLVVGGLDTVAASLSLMVDWLVRHPEERRRLVDDPTRIPGAVEELMRFETPVVAGTRYATADFELAGEQVRAGDQLEVCWASANLDDAFEDPVAVDFDRPFKRHIAFASGFHRCLGSHLARMELTVILGALLERVPDLEHDPEQRPGYNNNTQIRVVDPLPLVFAPR